MSKNIEKDTFERFYNNKALRITLLILAVASGLITIYAAFFQEKHCNLQYQITTSTNVLDINTEISKLDILFDGESLKDKKENIKIYNIRIANTGNKDITIDYYDTNDPIGINIGNGYLIDKPELISSSNPYIERNLENRIISDSISIKLPSLIIEREEFFVLKFMIIHKSDETPYLNSIGKIAGQKEIEIIQYIEKTKLPFFVKTFQGNIWIQVVRLLIYTIVSIIIIIVIALITEKINSIKTKKKRKKTIEKFKEEDGYIYKRIDDAIFERFITNGAEFLEPMLTLTQSNEKLNEFYKTALEKVKNKPEMRSSSSNSTLHFESTSEKNIRVINEMINDGIIINENDVLEINLPMRKTVELLSKFLKKNKKKEKGNEVLESALPIDV